MKALRYCLEAPSANQAIIENTTRQTGSPFCSQHQPPLGANSTMS